MTIPHWLFVGGMVCVLLFSFYQMGKAALDFRRDYPRYRGVLGRLESFERHCFKSGLGLFFIIPFLKHGEHSKGYLIQVLAEVGTALAGGMFLIGVIAFIRELHNTNSNS